MKNMTKSSTRGILLSAILLFSIIIISMPSDVHAAEINVKSIGLDETTIVQITNESNEEVKTIRMWLGSDFNFESFKTEKEWTGKKTSQGVIVFTSSETIKPGQAVKFGIKADRVTTGINWKALDSADKQIGIGKVLQSKIPPVIPITDKTNTTIPDKPEVIPDVPEIIPDTTNSNMTVESTFKIIPTKPTAGSDIRVAGEKFRAEQEFDFYINTEKLGSFVTDNNGNFMTTMKIPDNQEADRVDFKIKDNQGEEKIISLRIEELEDRVLETTTIPITIQGLPDIIYIGDNLKISGTGQPDSVVTIKVTNAKDEIINTRTADINSLGNWELEESIIIGPETSYGRYSATITDGKETKVQFWSVESGKIILISPSKLKFEQGEIMKFSGTAIPNKAIEIILENPIGKTIYRDIFQVHENGSVAFEYQTGLSTTKGTYTVTAIQGKDKEFIFVGLGQLPITPVNIEFEQLNHKANDTAHIILTGKALEIVKLLIIDPSDNPKEEIAITLQPDGTARYELNLEDYASGIYTAVIKKGTIESTEIFTVGLQTGSGKIQIDTTKIDYLPGDSILILGNTESSNVLMDISLIDPDGKEIKVLETVSDKNGKITESSFIIPTDGKAGIWTVKAQSGPNFDVKKIEVLATLHKGMQVFVKENIDVSGSGQKIILINVIGASQTVEIVITGEDGVIIEQLLPIRASKEGKINLPWLIPSQTAPGTYTITATDSHDSAQNKFTLEEDNRITIE